MMITLTVSRTIARWPTGSQLPASRSAPRSSSASRWSKPPLNFGYVYSFKYYENKPIDQSDNYDQTLEFDAALTHAFSERYQLTVRDSFVIGQEPDFLRAGNTYTTFQRISGDNMRNYGSITSRRSVDSGYFA